MENIKDLNQFWEYDLGDIEQWSDEKLAEAMINARWLMQTIFDKYEHRPSEIEEAMRDQLEVKSRIGKMTFWWNKGMAAWYWATAKQLTLRSFRANLKNTILSEETKSSARFRKFNLSVLEENMVELYAINKIFNEDLKRSGVNRE